MAKIRVNKADAARRQLCAAIRMTFGGEDPIAVHSVAASAHRIIRDICEGRGDIESYLRFTDRIAPGHESEFWGAVNASANFFKHADNDVDAIHEMDEEATDYMIAFACRWYVDLGFELSNEMRQFGGWFMLCHPKLFKPDPTSAAQHAHLLRQFPEMSAQMAMLPRSDKLRVGRAILQKPIGTTQLLQDQKRRVAGITV
jgi:hypothetical protein